MKKLTCSLALLGLLGLGLVPAAHAAGTITVYFNSAGTVRTMNSPGAGMLQTVHIYGQGFDDMFINGAQYQVDYGPQLTWLSDTPQGGVVIGESPTGISIGFGFNIKAGAKFKTQTATLLWNSDCAATINANLRVNEHPDFPDPTPIFSRFPTNEVLIAEGQRSQSCQLVEMDISPAFCPNFFPANAWDYIGSAKPWKAGIIAVAVLGSPTVNVNDIDASTVLLNGVAPLSWPQTTWFDVASTDGDNDCACDNVPVPDDDDDDGEDHESLAWLINFDPDGKKDLLIFFRRVDLAAAIGPTAPATGTEVTLSLTGAYDDGMPFSSSGCVVIKGGHGHGHPKHHGGSTVSAGLGQPSPNPFNPVTRISYTVPSAQHVRIAIYDVAGRLVENLVNEVKAPGEYMVEWNAGNLPSGVYFYRMQTGDQTLVRRATLLK
jgi:hypothetical protein